MKKMKKVMPILMMVLLLVATISPAVLAAGSGVSPVNYGGNDTNMTKDIDSLGNQIIRVVSTVGTIVAVIVLVVLGIKYMMGSAEERHEYKKTLMPYIIGAIFVFAASAITGMIFNFSEGIGNNSASTITVAQVQTLDK